MEYLKRQSRPVQDVLRTDCCCWGVEKSEAIGQTAIICMMTASLLLLLFPEVESLASGLPCCSTQTGCRTLLTIRISAAYVIFLLLCAILELIQSSRTKTTVCLWVTKIVIIISACSVSVYIPPPFFDRTWMTFLLFGAMTFIIMQVYVLVRLSYVGIIKLHRMVENGSNWARRFQVLLFILGVVVPVLGEIFLIYFYPLCGLNIVFLLTNAVIPFIACLWSMSDCVKATNGYSGFAQGGIFACFIIFYTWSALSTHSNPTCNPYFEHKTIVILRQCLFVFFAHVVYFITMFFSYHVYIEEVEESSPSTERDDQSDGIVQAKPKNIIREEIIHVYIPQFNTFLGAAMMCYVVLSLLNWTYSDDAETIEKESRTAMWFKLVGCWLSVLFFVVTLYTPSLYGIFPRKYLLRRT